MDLMIHGTTGISIERLESIREGGSAGDHDRRRICIQRKDGDDVVLRLFADPPEDDAPSSLSLSIDTAS